MQTGFKKPAQTRFDEQPESWLKRRCRHRGWRRAWLSPPGLTISIVWDRSRAIPPPALRYWSDMATEKPAGKREVTPLEEALPLLLATIAAARNVAPKKSSTCFMLASRRAGYGPQAGAAVRTSAAATAIMRKADFQVVLQTACWIYSSKRMRWLGWFPERRAWMCYVGRRYQLRITHDETRMLLAFGFVSTLRTARFRPWSAI